MKLAPHCCSSAFCPLPIPSTEATIRYSSCSPEYLATYLATYRRAQNCQKRTATGLGTGGNRCTDRLEPAALSRAVHFTPRWCVQLRRGMAQQSRAAQQLCHGIAQHDATQRVWGPRCLLTSKNYQNIWLRARAGGRRWRWHVHGEQRSCSLQDADGVLGLVVGIGIRRPPPPPRHGATQPTLPD